MFYGNHNINIKRTSVESSIAFPGQIGGVGEVQLASYGAKLSIGYRRTFFQTAFVEIGADVGKAWTNQGKDTMTITPSDKSEEPYEYGLAGILSGNFIEPMLSVGFLF